MYKYDVSIVIPIYNAELYLEECINSIVNQKYDLDKIEMILVNDGSTDNSVKICENLKRKYKNIVIINQKNAGVSNARNNGIKSSKGKYIMLLDPDDMIGDKTVRNLVRFFDKHYDEVDLVTYPIYWYKDGSVTKHVRYAAYDKGTDVYDFEEYPHLNQSTVNIIIKNEYEKTNLYNENMKLSEDQKFNTDILMKKQKIGFVKDATYYYRRHGEGVSQTKNNPYYCFEDIMKYNESLINQYKNGKDVPKYIQYLVANTIKWRINSDEIFPYHYDKPEYNKALKRIVNLLKYIDNDTIMNLENANIYLKFYILNLKGEKVEIKKIDNTYAVFDKCNNLLFQSDNFEIAILRFKVKNNQLYIFGDVRSPLLNYENLDSLKIVTIDKTGNIKRKSIKTFKSNFSCFKTNIEIAKMYGFEYTINLDNISKFYFEVCIGEFSLPIKIVFGKWSGYSKQYHRYTIFKENKCIKYCDDKLGTFKIKNEGIFNRTTNFLRTLPRYVKKNFNIISYRMLGRKKEKIWLYYDSKGVVDNGYLQFKHDIKKNDGIKRYYINLSDEEFANKYFSDDEKKHVINFKSFKHKLSYLRCEKIFVSYLSDSIYIPFKSIVWYTDIINYDLIYLQHGILHADLLKMYAKEFTSIDKFIISSNFERENLINKYHYNSNDLLNSGMPRATNDENDNNPKNKILFAPSWRKYLIGPLINNERILREKDFINSSFYTKINNFINSKELQKLLKDNNLILDFKLHPIFKGYKDYFNTNDYIKISFGETKLSEYNIFITDFSSYQFDYIKYKRPIIYFLPDITEFKAGLHTYKSLDLPYDKAFGDLCLTSEELCNKIAYYVKNDCKMESKYVKRVDNFFDMSDNPCEKIYKSVFNK